MINQAVLNCFNFFSVKYRPEHDAESIISEAVLSYIHGKCLC